MHVVYAHGLGQKPDSWDAVLTVLDETIESSCPDLFALCHNRALTYPNLYARFKAYCHDMEGPLHLCGMSLGAVLALNYALDYPKKVQSLALIAPQANMPSVLLKVQNGLFRFMPEATFEKVGIAKKDMIALTNSMLKLNFTAQLHTISCPTLIVCGTKDYANKGAATKIAQQIPKAKLHFIEHARHEVNSTAAQQLAVVLKKFYSE